jgi:hypothetical protein
MNFFSLKSQNRLKNQRKNKNTNQTQTPTKHQQNSTQLHIPHQTIHINTQSTLVNETKIKWTKDVEMNN